MYFAKSMELFYSSSQQDVTYIFYLVHQCLKEILVIMKMAATFVLRRQWDIKQKITRVYVKILSVT